jgi:hypothetical protein
LFKKFIKKKCLKKFLKKKSIKTFSNKKKKIELKVLKKYKIMFLNKKSKKRPDLRKLLIVEKK